MRKFSMWIGLLLLVTTLASCNEPDEGPYTITFDHEDIESVEADVDESIDLSFLESDDGFFLGWEDTSGTVHYGTYIVDGDETLTPVFELFEDVLDLEYDELENYVRIIEYSGSAPRVKLPHTIDGYIVRSIMQEAFTETEPTRVDIPMTVYYVGIMAFSDMPNLEEVHFYGDYLGTIETIMGNFEFNDLIEDNPVCQSTSMDEEPTEDNPWVFEEGCPVTKVTEKSITTIGPDGKEYFTYSIEQPVDYAPLFTLNQNFSMTPFLGSENVTAITLPDKLHFLDPEIFTSLDNLEAVYIKNNPYIYSENGILYETETDYLAYYPSGLLTKDFTVPENIEGINRYALSGSHVESLTLHDAVTFEPNAFSYLTGLKDFVLNEDHAEYKVIDGIIYNDDETQLIVYPAGKEATTFMVPASVTTIGEFAFMNQQHIEHVVISEGVVTIMENAFLFNPSLTSVDIASTVEYIGANNFFKGHEEGSIDTMIIRNENTVIHAPGINLSNSEDLVIYIPDDLIQAYTDDMWWKYYAEQFVPLSELEE